MKLIGDWNFAGNLNFSQNTIEGTQLAYIYQCCKIVSGWIKSPRKVAITRSMREVCAQGRRGLVNPWVHKVLWESEGSERPKGLHFWAELSLAWKISFKSQTLGPRFFKVLLTSCYKVLSSCNETLKWGSKLLEGYALQVWHFDPRSFNQKITSI